MPKTRNWLVSIARPGPTTSSHQPGDGSRGDAVTCFEAEIPPSTAMTGAPRGPTISQWTAAESNSPRLHEDSSVDVLVGSLVASSAEGKSWSTGPGSITSCC